MPKIGYGSNKKVRLFNLWRDLLIAETLSFTDPPLDAKWLEEVPG
jgi:hypothetical protein